MNKHTSGPWHQDEWGSVKTAEGESVKFSGLTLTTGSSAEIQANDRLVCAAPDLLDALLTCVEFINDAHIVDAQWCWNPIHNARSAIEKATGKKS